MRFTNANFTWPDKEPERHMKVDTAAADHRICIPRDHTHTDHQRGQDQFIPIISVLIVLPLLIVPLFRFRIIFDVEISQIQN